MLKMTGKKIITILHLKILLNWTYALSILLFDLFDLILYVPVNSYVGLIFLG